MKVGPLDDIDGRRVAAKILIFTHLKRELVLSNHRVYARHHLHVARRLARGWLLQLELGQARVNKGQVLCPHGVVLLKLLFI